MSPQSDPVPPAEVPFGLLLLVRNKTGILWYPFCYWLRNTALVREKEQILARQYDNHIAILNACKEGDPEKICREVKKHYWKTIFRMMQEQKIEDPNLEQAWMMAI